MKHVTITRDFAAWRTAARSMLAENVAPNDVVFSDTRQTELLPGLTIPQSKIDDAPAPAASVAHVSKQFLSTAKTAAYHRHEDRWNLLYRLLYRQTHGEPHLMQLEADDDVRQLAEYEKAVRRDRHKMTAFVRFRKIIDAAGEHYVAFHKPEHFVVPLVEEFFTDRFKTMRWTILTPDDSLHWDTETLTRLPGVEKSPIDSDDLEALWATYYGSIFNPARVKLNAMRKEMPVKHWKTLPETKLIPDLLQEAPQRVQTMIERSKTKTSAASFLPPVIEIKELREASKRCRGCPLYEHATQTVFGEGPPDAKIVFVGEQPGDSEDRAGRPFVGPAGQVFNEALEEAGIDRSITYVTNAVKHFKFEQRGTRRIHAKPSAREVAACRPWVEAELKAIKPQVVVCLGATAAQSLLGAGFRITQGRGHWMDAPFADQVIATWHPSAILRVPDEDARQEMRKQFVADLSLVAKKLTS